MIVWNHNLLWSISNCWMFFWPSSCALTSAPLVESERRNCSRSIWPSSCAWKSARAVWLVGGGARIGAWVGGTVKTNLKLERCKKIWLSRAFLKHNVSMNDSKSTYESQSIHQYAPIPSFHTAHLRARTSSRIPYLAKPCIYRHIARTPKQYHLPRSW